MDNKLTEMAIEMIQFLQKWGLWYNTSIFTNGNSYSYSEDKDRCYHNLPYVEFEEGVDAIFEKYGLWYELCFYWTLTTYRVEDEE